MRQPAAGLLPLARHCVTVVLCLQGLAFEAGRGGAGVSKIGLLVAYKPAVAYTVTAPNDTFGTKKSQAQYLE